MTDFVTLQGLQIKTVEQMLAELSAQQKAVIDVNLDTSADSPVGQLNGVFSSQLREAWEALQTAYDGFSADAAEGKLLEALCTLTGTEKHAATKGTVLLQVQLTAGTTLQNGVHYAAVLGHPENRWTIKTNFTAPADGTYPKTFVAENAGHVVANNGTIAVINTPLAGWTAVVQLDGDAVPGNEADTDAQLRLRREQELRASGSATVDSMRADLLQNSNGKILQASVFENVEDFIDPVTGLPPHSMQAVIYDGVVPAMTNDEVAQLIWNSKPGGVKMIGTLSGNAVDSLGNTHAMKFDRPAIKDVYLVIDASINSGTGYAGQAALKAKIVTLNDTYQILGRDVIAKRISQICMDFAGIWDVTSLKLGFAAAPAGTANLAVGPQQLARFDTAKITVNETFSPIP